MMQVEAEVEQEDVVVSLYTTAHLSGARQIHAFILEYLKKKNSGDHR
jgi:methenyltetrahydromethanopterin cyclohydrolase